MKPFREKYVNHSFMEDALLRILALLKNPAGKSVCLVYGPTGVGKTRLSYTLRDRLNLMFRNELEEESGVIPFCSVEVPCQARPIFDWRDVYIRLLEALQEPHIVKKIAISEVETPGDTFQKRSRYRGQSEADLRRAVERCIYHRRTRVLIFDEAQHFNNVAGGEQLLRQLDILKSLASITKSVIVLVGTYELRNFITPSGQIARRMMPVHFPRYNVDQKEDRESFLRVLKSFEDALPFKKRTDLVKNWKYLCEGCSGCVGILKDWLDRAITIALEGEDEALLEKHLRETRLTPDAIKSIIDEIREGELRDDTSFPKAPNNIAPKSRGTLKPVGVRSATRDPIGKSQ